MDLNLLPVLEALLRHRSVTKAADAVGLTQSAASRALGRLRHLLDDPLLVRGPDGMTTTPRAEALRGPLSGVLEDLRRLLVASPFDPSAERRVLRLAMTDLHSALLMPYVLGRLAEEAPHVVLRVTPVTRDTAREVQSGLVDLALALDTTPLPPGARSEFICEDQLAVAVRRGHPCAGRGWTLEDYGRYPSVTVALLNDGVSELDAELAMAGVERQVSAIVPHFSAALAMVAKTDCVTTVSRAFAARFAEALGLQLLEPPLTHTRLGIVAVWGPAADADPFLSWTRGLLARAAGATPAR